MQSDMIAKITKEVRGMKKQITTLLGTSRRRKFHHISLQSVVSADDRNIHSGTACNKARCEVPEHSPLCKGTDRAGLCCRGQNGGQKRFPESRDIGRKDS